MSEIVLLLHNIRSAHNVGSILRTAEGFGVKKIIITGYTPYPEIPSDDRLPHIRSKLTKDIAKTALGAETLVEIVVKSEPPLAELKKSGFTIVGLEQSKSSVNIRSYTAPDKMILILGEEVNGINNNWLSQCDDVIEIPMNGLKESFNVSVAAAIALYQLTS